MPPIDRPRVLSIDLARGLAVVFMVAVHVLITCGSEAVRESPFGEVVDFLGGPPAAPVFMMLMGVSWYFSRRSGLRAGLWRGATIIALGYVLNLLRGVLPVTVAQLAGPDLAAGIPAAVADRVDAFIALDILQFAGLSLMVMAVLRRLAVPRDLLLAAAVAVAAASPHLWGLHTGHPFADRLLDYLWGDRPSSSECIGNLISFPFFPWFSFVLVGMWLGDRLSTADDGPRLIRRAGLAGLGLLAASLVVMIPHYQQQMGDYYHCRPGAVAFITGIALAWLAGCQLLVERIPANPVFALIFHWSKHVNRIYMIQWILIMWTAVFLTGFDRCPLWATAGLMVAMMVAVHYANELCLRVKARLAGTPAAG